MTKQYVIYAAAALAGVMLIAAAAGSIGWKWKADRLERETESLKAAANAKEAKAAEKETAAHIYRAKIEHLERSLEEISNEANKQDEELEKLGGDIGRARGDVERARRVRSIATSNAELCRKLAELGYPCGGGR